MELQDERKNKCQKCSRRGLKRMNMINFLLLSISAMKIDLGNIINPFMKSIIVFECFIFSFKSFKIKWV